MSWELARLELVDHGGAARTFQFEVLLAGTKQQAQCLVRGDGFVLDNGRVRFNREEELRSLIYAAGSNPQHFLDYLGTRVIEEVPRLAPQAS